MKISTRGRYALRMMIELAKRQGDGYISLTDLSERLGVSKKYLEQIIPSLSRASFLLTYRGHSGGYRLTRAPEDYSVGEVLRVTEGSIAPVRRPRPSFRLREYPELPDVSRLEGTSRRDRQLP